MKRLCSLVLIAAILLIPTFATAAEPDTILPFDGATGWLNSSPLTPAELRGKIVLVDFWEYTCVNCLRTLPYLREWYKRYASMGFVIVGVHTPEFTFSSESKNVDAADKRLGVTWPVALDSKNAIWDRYGTNNWPHELLFDQNGKRIESVIGEGSYPQTEAHIQALLQRRESKREAAADHGALTARQLRQAGCGLLSANRRDVPRRTSRQGCKSAAAIRERTSSVNSSRRSAA